MSPDIQVQTRKPRAAVRLRVDNSGVDVLTRMAQSLGLTTDTQIATFLGISEKQLSRARGKVDARTNSRYHVGDQVMAKSITALRRRQRELAERGYTPSLDALYEVYEYTPQHCVQAA